MDWQIISSFFWDVLSACGLLFPVIDPVGNVFPIESVMGNVQTAKEKRKIVAREILMAAGILLFFLFFGSSALAFLQIDKEALRITGGVLLFLIALPMVFPKERTMQEVKGKPFIVPIAIPLIAGPSSMTVIILMRGSYSLAVTIVSLLIILGISFGLLCAGTQVVRFLGDKGSQAVERLMGLILIAISVQMLVAGFSAYTLDLFMRLEDIKEQKTALRSDAEFMQQDSHCKHMMPDSVKNF